MSLGVCMHHYSCHESELHESSSSLNITKQKVRSGINKGLCPIYTGIMIGSVPYIHMDYIRVCARYTQGLFRVCALYTQGCWPGKEIMQKVQVLKHRVMSH